MDLILLERLATAGASLEAAKDYVEIGGKCWEMINNVTTLVEGLIEIEVNDLWDQAEGGEVPS